MTGLKLRAKKSVNAGFTKLILMMNKIMNPTPTPETDAKLESERDALKTECSMLQIERSQYARERDEVMVLLEQAGRVHDDMVRVTKIRCQPSQMPGFIAQLINNYEAERDQLRNTLRIAVKLKLSAQEENDQLHKVCDAMIIGMNAAYCEDSGCDNPVCVNIRALINTYNSLPHVIERNKTK